MPHFYDVYHTVCGYIYWYFDVVWWIVEPWKKNCLYWILCVQLRTVTLQSRVFIILWDTPEICLFHCFFNWCFLKHMIEIPKILHLFPCRTDINCAFHLKKHCAFHLKKIRWQCESSGLAINRLWVVVSWDARWHIGKTSKYAVEQNLASSSCICC